MELERTYPLWKSPLLSSDYEYILVKRQLQVANEKLDEKNRERDAHLIEMKKNWDNLKTKQQEFKNSLTEYDKFYNETKEKEERLMNRLQIGKELLVKYEEDEKNLSQSIDYLSSIKCKMQTAVEESIPWEEFLTNLIAGSEFNTIEQLINRYKNLISLRIESSNEKYNIFYSDNLPSLESSEKENSGDNVMKLSKLENNDKPALQKYKDSSDYENQQNDMVEKCCENIYNVLCKWKKTRNREKGLENQLIFINKSVIQLKKLSYMVQTISKDDNGSSKPNLSCKSQKKRI